MVLLNCAWIHPSTPNPIAQPTSSAQSMAQPTNETAQTHPPPPYPSCDRVPARSSPKPPRSPAAGPNSPTARSTRAEPGPAAGMHPCCGAFGRGRDRCIGACWCGGSRCSGAAGKGDGWCQVWRLCFRYRWSGRR